MLNFINKLELPSIFSWVADKMDYSIEARESYSVEQYVFVGMFNNNKAPKDFFKQVEVDGIEYIATVSVQKAKYTGQKAKVSVNFSIFTPK